MRELRSAKKEPNQTRIFTAGEKEYFTSIEREKMGVPITKSVLQELRTIRDEQSLDYVFPFISQSTRS